MIDSDRSVVYRHRREPPVRAERHAGPADGRRGRRADAARRVRRGGSGVTGSMSKQDASSPTRADSTPRSIVPWLKENYDCEVHSRMSATSAKARKSSRGIEDKAAATSARASNATSLDLQERRSSTEFDLARRCSSVARLRGALPDRHELDGAPDPRARPGRGTRVKVGADGRRARLHGQGQRPGALRARLPGDRARARDHRALARLGHQEPRGRARLRRASAGIPVTATRKKIYSRDRNLWHISHEGGAISSSRTTAPPARCRGCWTTDPQRGARTRAAEIDRVAFEAGVPDGGQRPDALDPVDARSSVLNDARRRARRRPGRHRARTGWLA